MFFSQDLHSFSGSLNCAGLEWRMEKQRSEGGGGGGGRREGCNVGSFNIDIVFTAVLASIALSRKMG